MQGLNAGLLPSLGRILLVTDFSSCSEAAAPFARWLADSYQGSVTVAHVLPGELVDAPNQAVFGTPEELAGVADRNMQAFIERNGLRGAESVITAGVVSNALTELIGKRATDLVVVGTHGRTGVGKLLLGSIAQRIFNTVPCPVMTVSPRAMRSGADPKSRKVLYATDFSRQALQALPYALSLAQATGSALLLTHVAGDTAAADWAVFRERLVQMAPQPTQSWLEFEPLVLSGDPAGELVRAAAERGAEFIVLGGRKIDENAMYRVNVQLTTAYQVVAHAHCPVLRVRT